MQNSEEKEYKVVNPLPNHDSDDDDMPIKETNNLTLDSKDEKLSQHQELARPVPKTIEINSDYSEINVRIKQEWKDRLKELPELKYKKKDNIEIKDPILFTFDKEEVKHGRSFFASFFSIDYRYIYLTEGYMLVLCLKNDKLIIKSLIPLSRLFKIIIKQNQILLCFFNEQMDKKASPKVKKYKFIKGVEQKGKFLMRIRVELNKIGQEFDIIK